MITLQPNEQLLTGYWNEKNGEVCGDTVCARIEWLLTYHLHKITDSPLWGAWETLYRDPNDGRFWERTYPQSEMHGGGPPQLRCLTLDEARQKYGVQLGRR